MMINLPRSCRVDKFIPKKTFYDKVGVSTKVKDDFVKYIDKIMWRYKLSEETLGTIKTEDVEEIQIFEIDLKIKKIPKSIINVICKSIPYKILFLLKFEDEYCYAIKYEDVYYSSWNEDIRLSFDGLNLKNVYKNIVKAVIKRDGVTKKFGDIIDDKKRFDDLKKQINQIENKIRRERQFNRKVQLNQKLNSLRKELKVIENEEN